MKKKIIFIGSLICNIILIICAIIVFDENKEILSSTTVKKDKHHTNSISMMFEESVLSGNYKENKGNEWPTENYVFNKQLSTCENGSELSWDSSTNQILMAGNVADKCYVYFDRTVPSTLGEACLGDNMADCFKRLYTIDPNIYYHKNLANSAEDKSYRYAGSYEDVNNYVCFGSTLSPCQNTYLYRIIGIFGDQVKLIKADYATSSNLGTNGSAYINVYSKVNEAPGTNKGSNSKSIIGSYYWSSAQNSDGSSIHNVWSTSTLNTANLNGTFLKGFSSRWQEKIATANWQVGGVYESNFYNKTPKEIFNIEILNPTYNTKYAGKIALMYVSDFLYGASPEYWSLKAVDKEKCSESVNTCSTDYRSTVNSNWLFGGLMEWMLTPESSTYNDAYAVTPKSVIYDSISWYVGHAVRPAFYLESSVKLLSGSGTNSDPYRISVD